MRQKKRRGRVPVSEDKHHKCVLFSLSPAAFRKLQLIPKNERSRKISSYLERCDPGVLSRDLGERWELPKSQAKLQMPQDHKAEAEDLELDLEPKISEPETEPELKTETELEPEPEYKPEPMRIDPIVTNPKQLPKGSI